MNELKEFLPFVEKSEILSSAAIFSVATVWLLNQYISLRKSFAELQRSGESAVARPQRLWSFPAKLSVAIGAAMAATLFRYLLPEFFPALKGPGDTFQTSLWPRHGRLIGLGFFPLLSALIATAALGKAAATREYIMVSVVLVILIPFSVSALLFSFPEQLGGPFCELVSPANVSPDWCAGEWRFD